MCLAAQADMCDHVWTLPWHGKSCLEHQAEDQSEDHKLQLHRVYMSGACPC